MPVQNSGSRSAWSRYRLGSMASRLLPLAVAAIGIAPMLLASEPEESGMGMSAAIPAPHPGLNTNRGSDLTWRDGITDLAASADGQVIAVGPTGLVMDLGTVATRLIPRAASGERSFLAVAADEAGTYWVADRQGQVSRFGARGELFPAQDTGAQGALFKLARLADGSLLGVGEFGSVVALPEGTRQWRALELPWPGLLKTLQDREGDVVPHLYGVCQAPNGDLYLTGEYGLILARTSAGWHVSREADSSGNLFACAASADGSVLAVGQIGRAVLLSGEGWRQLPAGTPNDLYAVAWDDGDFVAVGDQGAVLALRGGAADAEPVWRASTPSSAVSVRWLSAILATDNQFVVAGSGGYIERLSLP